MTVWVKVIAVTNWARIIDFANLHSDNMFLSTSFQSSGCPVSTVYNASSRNQYATSSLALQLNQWTHLAHVYSSSTCKVYLNGTLTASAACLPPQAVTRSNCYVGKSNWAADGLLNGQLDELRIYNRSLNISEIKQFSSGYTTTTATCTTSTMTIANFFFDFKQSFV